MLVHERGTGRGTPIPRCWRGAAVSPGTGRGPAHRVRTIGEAIAVPPDSVVVADALPPGWVWLLRRPAAVLVGCGGVLSNTATALRERRVPALADVTGLDALRDGDRVDVDAGSGLARAL